MRAKSLARALIIGGLLALAVSSIALAHTSLKIGPYTVEVGWVDEPPIVGEKNAVFISITNDDTGKPVEGVSTLNVLVSTGGKERQLELRPLSEAQPGQYAADFIPTRRGIYTVKLSGQIEKTDVVPCTDIEEVVPASSLQFPEPVLDAQAISQSVSDAQSAASTANTTALIALVVGIIGVLLGGLGLLRSRKA